MPTPDNQARAEVLEKAVDECDNIVKKQAKALTNKLLLECFFTIVIPVVAAIITYFFSSATVALAPLAVGATNAAEKITSSKTLLTTYFKDKSTLETKISVFLVKIKLALQEPDSETAKKDLDAVAIDIGNVAGLAPVKT